MNGLDTNEKRVPPYLPFRTLDAFLANLKQSVPDRIDRSLMQNLSGSVQNQLLSALKYLHLTDEQLYTKPLLTEIVNAEGAGRQTILCSILRSSYPFLFENFNLSNATSIQLNDKFRSSGASGETIRKCALFFTAAAKEAGIEMSPYIDVTAKVRSDSKNKRTSRRPALKLTLQPVTNKHPEPTPHKLTWNQMLMEKFPNFNPDWPETVQAKWFDNFGRLMGLGTDTIPDEQENQEI